MACTGCRGNNKTTSGRRQGGNGDLSKFAYLKPNQLKLLEQQKKEQEEKDKENK